MKFKLIAVEFFHLSFLLFLQQFSLEVAIFDEVGDFDSVFAAAADVGTSENIVNCRRIIKYRQFSHLIRLFMRIASMIESYS